MKIDGAKQRHETLKGERSRLGEERGEAVCPNVLLSFCGGRTRSLSLVATTTTARSIHLRSSLTFSAK
ncbi:hypothetical protein E2C01_029964 [Portunus trituberculatus]|uniref:Uncharacterized protein n=1 Tax=Portunus trituberculatus TaxID=210409 RepID=A0A5B7EW04_PORTR|nr:hypothetical protein [Portunus trituberculatus]